jgi:hypothetical protein
MTQMLSTSTVPVKEEEQPERAGESRVLSEMQRLGSDVGVAIETSAAETLWSELVEDE